MPVSLFRTMHQMLRLTEIAPASQGVGQRLCLIIQVLKNWNWNDPLFVPLYEQDASLASGALVPDISTSAWALSTAVDIGGHVWTGPNLDDTIACGEAWPRQPGRLLDRWRVALMSKFAFRCCGLSLATDLP